ncbi:MAG: excinuclease ABC subunit UvrC [Candidatus Omnitrophota bacterium]|nr:MAG: excinuclease ABC subunit UvrC [Candidatus Omnitrophota bacterium]
MSVNELKDKISSLPESCGVYLFKDARGHIVYVGKAKSIKKRVQSYFNRFLSSKTQSLVAKIADIEYKTTTSESQAQLLEALLIKDFQPYYNISLKDDKSFPLIRITNEQFPLVSICRSKSRKKGDAAFYFGPFTSAKLLRQALKVIRRIFGFRSCKKMPKQPCLYYRVKLCPAPCVGKISPSQYQEVIKGIKMFLESRYEALLGVFLGKMHNAVTQACFEEAAKIRDQISALSIIGQSATQAGTHEEIEDLKNLLGFRKVPLCIEAFDISNISGKEACGSMVYFYKGVADKNNYRRFRIKGVEGIDDYAMIREVVQRRYSRLIREGAALPDLIIIDGGKSHLAVAKKEVRGLGLHIPLISIAKDREHIYREGKKAPLKLNSDTPGLNLIRRIRDEAHRFAVAYHHILRRKKIIGR